MTDVRFQHVSQRLSRDKRKRPPTKENDAIRVLSIICCVFLSTNCVAQNVRMMHSQVLTYWLKLHTVLVCVRV